MVPWNYPVQLTLTPLLTALAAGNCAVVKPSAYAPESSKVLSRMLTEAFPREYVAVVEGGRQENTALLDGKFDYIFFTGSTEVGRTVMAAAAKHLTPVTLELGGKSPCIIAEDADLELSAKRIAWGKFLNAGQTCVAPDHIWVKRGQQEELVRCLRRAITRFYTETPLNNPRLPRIVNEKHYKRLLGLIEPEKVVIGGKSLDEPLRIEPTVMVNVTEDDAVMGEEIFGPILPILIYDDLDELIVRLQQKPKPLSLYLFTNNREVERRVMGRLSFGGGCVNDTAVHLGFGHAPFGGVGESGMGSYHGKAGFDTFSHYKTVVRRRRIDIPLRYPPYGDKQLRILKKLM
jgi:aldehyde dehydrogenase (NAD+)